MTTLRALAAMTLLLEGCAPSIVSAGGHQCEPPAHARLHFPADPPPPAGATREARLIALLGLGGALADRLPTGELSTTSRVRVLERMELARLSVAATSAELGCEAERADQAADYLSRKGTRAVQTLTVASIAAATATAIAGVLLSTNNAKAGPQDATAVGGGAVTAGLGLGTLYVHPHLTYTHPRNMLGDVWQPPPEVVTFPPMLWAYLTDRRFSNEEVQSIREKMIARWRRYDGVESHPADARVLFGPGGDYDVDLLRTRSQMLEELRAEVDLVSQDLEVVAAEWTR